jgi:hypothetical protein
MSKTDKISDELQSLDAQGTNLRTFVLSSGRSVTLRDYPDGSTVEWDFLHPPISRREFAVLTATVSSVRWGDALERVERVLARFEALATANLDQLCRVLHIARAVTDKLEVEPHNLVETTLVCPNCGREQKCKIDSETLKMARMLHDARHQGEFLRFCSCNTCNAWYILAEANHE